MNKQQLAAKIWESANKMRSKIEANDYKDYILGFVFYKFLSEKQSRFLQAEGFEAAELLELLNEENSELVKPIQDSLGYFIAHENLFATWIAKGRDFDVSNVRDALGAFARLISPNHKKVYDNIFDTLQTGLSKLGDSAANQTRAISDLIKLINDIPMSGKQDYDVLGFIYEYLISMFAANAGKKAGEFYTPHEVSLLMSEIIAEHLKAREEIKIYDPTSGSGSLLINIGHSVAKHQKSPDSIRYYAQELKQNTYNLTRMNLIMRGIKADNIVTRNADTLEDDWPYFDESDPAGTYDPLYVDAVVSNPPYSQAWDPSHKESDPRYASFGLAPKTKADFAFLLHDLYHLRPNGIMAIVLPHGVLFRGGEEEQIRKNLIEKNHIDTIIGLPANVFFGTGIPTIIMILRQKRERDDVLFIDASKEFIKAGKQNKLQAAHIKKIVDAVIHRQNIDKFARVVSKAQIVEQGYNLNIPRYVDSSLPSETFDIYATMNGGIPQAEIDELKADWQAFPSLQNELFESLGQTPYCRLKTSNIKQTIDENSDTRAFVEKVRSAFGDFSPKLDRLLIAGKTSLHIAQTESELSSEIFSRLQDMALIDPYRAYQHFADQWQTIATDLEMIQSEGANAIKQVDPNMVIKKKNGKEVEEQDGYIGHILPFDLVQRELLADELASLQAKENRLVQISAELDSILENLSEEEKSNAYVNDDNTAFVAKEVNAALKVIYADVTTEETNALEDYLELLENKAKKPEKLAFIQENPTVNWQAIEASKDGTFAKAKVNMYLKQLRSAYQFDEESLEAKLVQVQELLDEEKELKAAHKKQSAELHLKTKATIEGLSDAQADHLLHQKWIAPLTEQMFRLPESELKTLQTKVVHLSEKYADTLTQISQELNSVEQQFAQMLGELVADEYDSQGIAALQALFK